MSPLFRLIRTIWGLLTPTKSEIDLLAKIKFPCC